MVLFIDMDEVLVNLLDTWVDELNKYDNVVPKRVSDIDQWDMSIAYPTLSKDELYGLLSKQSFWENVKPVNGAYYNLKKLKDDGHEIYIATSSYPLSFYYKIEFCLLKHFDFLEHKNIICIHNKSLLKGDILFDDYPENLKNFQGIKILKNTNYNKEYNDTYYNFRVNDWDQFYSLVTELNSVINMLNNNIS